MPGVGGGQRKVTESCFPSSRGTKSPRGVAARTGGSDVCTWPAQHSCGRGRGSPASVFPEDTRIPGARSGREDEALHQGPGLTSLAAFPGASVSPDGESDTKRPAVDLPGALTSSGGGDVADSPGKSRMSADFERWRAVA
ncbi:hypothetical protein P7K49_009721 [Saguinus oedipus]|uniref:Uncharacterized protein n=1 Tax=Saguinus oedipus TaxID=9490 RepID=A0ABQ9VLD5_SAGOE|nr:hypothetical protein P7K49_009721 [Saguinus oedipus]